MRLWALLPVSELPVLEKPVLLLAGANESVVNAPVFGVVLPIAEGLAKSTAAPPPPPKKPWNEHLANFGGEVIAGRLSLIQELEPLFQDAYKTSLQKKQPNSGINQASLIPPQIKTRINQKSLPRS